ncbi:hypothetical protein VCUG_01611 [Vavraia culicis subsp. floridensis]|uniref:Uncharacterized protein n=1 Tax=Vavraia culicis (isolate floridensis) TaxID=948595 RepID=L2GUF8_VAVCU|nr:uncharacterized protein VCUG_01611 [Vavraia culicis subsp. floridensis]ELA46913.1 hypothetical protein VCUG_01611 [Vavraia culicis subsp. floridensis]
MILLVVSSSTLCCDPVCDRITPRLGVNAVSLLFAQQIFDCRTGKVKSAVLRPHKNTAFNTNSFDFFFSEKSSRHIKGTWQHCLSIAPIFTHAHAPCTPRKRTLYGRSRCHPLT